MSTTRNGRPKRFSIDDAFEEETDEAIRVYGTTSPDTCRHAYKAATDSDSLIQDFYEDGSGVLDGDVGVACWRHPKVRENWRTVAVASALLIIGLGLLATGTISLAEPESGLQGSVFLLAGFICFVPGAYHVVYIYLAAKGRRGYHFHNLPLFT